MTDARVAVIGAGAWGTALARHLARNGAAVRLWAREEEVASRIRERGENTVFLPGVSLHRLRPRGSAPGPDRFLVTNDLERALDQADAVVWACPAQHSAALLARAAQHIPLEAAVVSATKGIEIATRRRMDQVFAAALPAAQARRFCVLSGPSFAREVCDDVPTAVVAASADAPAALRVQAMFQTDRFRVYTSPDVIGVELGGALKNVIAVAAGVAAGLDLGHNAVAALVTRGLAEMTRLGVAMGARPETFAGLAGMGDLVLTCTGGLSRNRSVGFRLGRGEPMAAIRKEARTVAEGVATVVATVRLADDLGVEVPVASEVFRIVEEGADPMEALDRLMAREPRPEPPGSAAAAWGLKAADRVEGLDSGTPGAGDRRLNGWTG